MMVKSSLVVLYVDFFSIDYGDCFCGSILWLSLIWAVVFVECLLGENGKNGIVSMFCVIPDYGYDNSFLELLNPLSLQCG